MKRNGQSMYIAILYILLCYFIGSKLVELCLPSDGMNAAKLSYTLCKDNWQKDTENHLFANLMAKDIHLYSAYYDTRTTLENRYVRIISMASDKIVDGILSTKFKVYCHLWMEVKNISISVVAELEIIQSHRQAKLTQHFAMLTCKLPSNIIYNNKILSLYSIIPRKVDLVSEVCGTSKLMVPVQATQCLQDSNSLNVVCKEKAKTIAICTKAFSGYVNPIRFVEWVELNRILGVQTIYMYNISLTGSKINTILRYYQRKNIINIKNNTFFHNVYSQTFSDNHSDQNSELEMVFHTDCLYSAYERHILSIEIGEILQPSSVNYNQLIVNYFEVDIYVCMLRFQIAIFADDCGKDNSTLAPDYLHMMHHRKRTKFHSEYYRSLIDYERCQIVDSLQCQKQVNTHVRTSRSVDVAQSYIRKYQKKSTFPGQPSICTEQHVDTSLEQYKWKLMEQVFVVLRRFQLISPY